MVTGAQIRRLRSDLDMDAQQFASLLGVHPTTLYRWESAGDRQVRVDPLQLKLLVALDQEVAKRKTMKAKAELANTITTALLVGGGLFALFKLLQAVFPDEDA